METTLNEKIQTILNKSILSNRELDLGKAANKLSLSILDETSEDEKDVADSNKSLNTQNSEAGFHHRPIFKLPKYDGLL